MIIDMKVVKRRDGRQKGADGKDVRNNGQENETGATGCFTEKELFPCACPP